MQFWRLLDLNTRELVGVIEVGAATDHDLALLKSTSVHNWEDVKDQYGFGHNDVVAYFPGISDPEPFEGLEGRYILERIHG